MTDLHSHILPGVDDGAGSCEEALQMLRTLSRRGFTDVLLSPHYYSNSEPLQSFLERRGEAFRALLEAAGGETLPKLHTGAEVYLTSLLFNNEDLSRLTINDRGKYMLVELPYDRKLSASSVSCLERLNFERGVTPVLAHIERYPSLSDGKTLRSLLEMGCKTQINCGSFAVRGYRCRLRRLVKGGCVDALGTDAHSADELERGIDDSISAVNRDYGEEFLRKISLYSKENFLYA